MAWRYVEDPTVRLAAEVNALFMMKGVAISLVATEESAGSWECYS